VEQGHVGGAFECLGGRLADVFGRVPQQSRQYRPRLGSAQRAQRLGRLDDDLQCPVFQRLLQRRDHLFLTGTAGVAPPPPAATPSFAGVGRAPPAPAPPAPRPAAARPAGVCEPISSIKRSNDAESPTRPSASTAARRTSGTLSRVNRISSPARSLCRSPVE